MKIKAFNNKIKIWTAALLGTLMLTGCSDAIPEMSDEQQKLIGEFAAITLMKYDANNRSRLVERRFVKGLDQKKEEQVKENPSEEKEPEKNPQKQESSQTPEKENEKENNIPQYRDVAEFLGLPEGITCSFSGLEFMESYTPANVDIGAFALDAAEGKILAVLNFALSNNAGEATEVDVLSKNPIFKVTFNGSETKNALTTLLETDLSTFKETLAPGEAENVVLLMEIEKGKEASVNTVSMLVKYRDSSYVFKLIE